MRWFRFYDDALNDPKVQRLPCELFRAWVNLLCLASKNDGRLPPFDEIIFALRVDEDEANSNLHLLVEKGLIDEVDGELQPHNWAGRQYATDDAAGKQRRYRERKKLDGNAVTPALRAVTGHVPTMSPARTDTDTDTDTEKKQKRKKDPAADAPEFLEFWPIFLQIARPGDSKKAAAKAHAKAIADGASHPEIMLGLKRYVARLQREAADKRFTPGAAKWLNEARWASETGPQMALVTDSYARVAII